MSTSENKLNVSDETKKIELDIQNKLNVSDVIKKIELETHNKLFEACKKGQLSIKDNDKKVELLENIMSEGASDFKKIMKRDMTYLELRLMFG